MPAHSQDAEWEPFAEPSPLARKLAEEIRRDGPMSLSQMLTRALHDPEFGFYTHEQPFGREGHFLTAPEVSQMFGELIGLWAVACWQQMGRPDPFDLIELGPGRGTLMADALRAARLDRGFCAAARLTLVEASARLRAEQAERLQNIAEPSFANSLASCASDKPFILIANEFLDCLGVRQYVRDPDGWRELKLGVTEQGALAIGRVSEPALAVSALANSLRAEEAALPVGTLLELSPTTDLLIGEVCHWLERQDGYALFIDYGSEGLSLGSSLQALWLHRRVDPIQTLGQADLTHHVSFATLKAAAAAFEGVSVAGPVEQGAFLRALGLDIRAKALMQRAPHQTETLQRQYARLVDADQMGSLFKALALYRATLPAPPGLA
jgi:SAM-dependent MidA family methyltransferase